MTRAALQAKVRVRIEVAPHRGGRDGGQLGVQGGEGRRVHPNSANRQSTAPPPKCVLPRCQRGGWSRAPGAYTASSNPRID